MKYRVTFAKTSYRTVEVEAADERSAISSAHYEIQSASGGHGWLPLDQFHGHRYDPEAHGPTVVARP